MELRQPPPILAAYLVVELKNTIDKVTRKAGLVAEPPRAVNTFDINQQIMLPGLFIVAWQEIHYELYFDTNGAPRYQEKWHTFTHNENQARINQIREYWKGQAQNHPLAKVEEPNYNSFEQDLLQLGWQFRYDPGTGPVFPPEWEPQLNCVLEPDVVADKQQVERNMPVMPSQPLAAQQPYTPPQPVVSPPVPQTDNSDGIHRIELKIEKLTDTLEQFLGVMANALNHNAPNGERYPSEPATEYPYADRV